MKKYLLSIFFFLLSFCLFNSSFAQNNNGRNKYEIVGNQQPCVGTLEIYTITPNPGNNPIELEWDGPRAQSGEIDWEIVEVSSDKSKVTFRVGDKPGTIRAKATPGTNNTENLPVHPGKGLDISLEGPNTLCANVPQVYKLVIKNLNRGKKDKKDLNPEDLKITWTLPSGLTITSGENTSILTVKATDSFKGGTIGVSVEVPFEPNTGPDNNGKGIGRITGFCGGKVNSSIAVGVGTNCSAVCPVSSVIIEGPATVCASQEELVTYTANVTNGTPNMQFAWEIPTGWAVSSGATTNEIKVKVGTAPGQISVRVTNNCSATAATANKIVAFGNNCGNPNSDCPTPQVSITGSARVCPSQRQGVTFSAVVPNATPNTTYKWQVPSGWFLNSGQGTNNIEVLVGNTEGQISVVVTNNCDKMASAAYAVTFSNNCGGTPPVCTTPRVNISGPLTVCPGQSQSVIFTSGVGEATPNMTYTWTVPTGWFLKSGQGSSAIEVIVGNTAGQVGLTVKNNCGNSASDVHSVAFRNNCGTTLPDCSAPLVSVSGPVQVCAYGEDPVVFTANVTGGSDDQEFIWSVPEDWFIISGENSASITVLVGFESGTVGLTVRNNVCGKSASFNKGVLALEDCSALEPLPVELLNFSGQSTKSGVLLQWATAMEQNNDRFEIERSTNGQTFTKIGQVKGNGNSNSKRIYTLRDSRAGKGLQYYRLKQIDFNGDFTYSQIIPVDHTNAAALNQMVIAPNPVNNGQFILSLPQTATDAQVQIIDLSGKVLYTQRLEAGSNEATFSTQALNIKSGVYLLKLQDGNLINQSRLVIK